MVKLKKYIEIKEVKNIAIYAVLFQVIVILIQIIISTGISTIFPSDEIIKLEYESYMYFIWAIIFAPIIEEIIFRQGLYGLLKKKISLKKAMVIASIIFGVIHIQPITIIFAFFAGYNCCLIYEKYKTIIAPIIFHSVCNAIGLINGNFLRDFYVNKGVLITAIIFTISIVLLVATIILHRRQAENIFKNSSNKFI
ncbi:CAAX amino terminal protease self- immunity [Clostridium tertium]|uniref:CAAX amino terminal protease self- immunity n=1 Tax=Clostridium tertium TaxID=1559 RepID=A0A6N3FNA8_9CLOT